MNSCLPSEFDDLELGDVRLVARARKALSGLAVDPSAGAPRVLTTAELEGYYRFVNNERVTFAALLAAHAKATGRRALEETRVVVAHDTTDFRFRDDETQRVGLGPMDNSGQGFYAHFSLALGAERRALGVVAAEVWVRSSRIAASKTSKQRREDPAKETLRWARGVAAAHQVLSSQAHVVHVMDREADDYELLRELVANKRSFVVRSKHDRRLVDEDRRLKAFVADLDIRCERVAQLTARARQPTAKRRRLHPKREVRTARLSFSAQSVIICRPDNSNFEPRELRLNVVHVHEPSPPQGCAPVEWTLLTTEPVETEEQIFQVVDDYRSRWVIEEYFKALKTGCSFEKRQHESKDALLNALGVYVPIAWSLLNIRTLSRANDASKRPAEDVFSSRQLQILRLSAPHKLSHCPTLLDAVLLLARVFGGHLPSNGMPGWHVLGRAFEKLLVTEAGWNLAMSQLARGQSETEFAPPRSDR